MRPLRILAALLLPLTVSAACGDEDDGGVVSDDGDGSGSTSPSVPPGATPGGQAGDLFVSLEYVGGFVPVGFDFRTVPAVTVYADGTVVVPGATIAVFPGPAVAPLSTGTLDGDVLAELLDAVAAAGLLAEAPPDPGDNPLVADAATTRITVVVDGRDTVVEAYALDVPVDGSTPGIDDEQLEVRRRLTQLVSDISNAATAAATDPFEPAGYRVLATELGGDPGVEPNRLDWPAGLPAPVLDECVAVTGEGAATLRALLAEATQITRWAVAGEEVGLAIRPLLPHEDGC